MGSIHEKIEVENLVTYNLSLLVMDCAGTGFPNIWAVKNVFENVYLSVGTFLSLSHI